MKKRSSGVVLYFDHSACLGGGERSLLDVLGRLNTSRYEPVLVTPVEGPLVDAAGRMGFRWRRLDVKPELLRRRRRQIRPLSPAFFADLTVTAAAAVGLYNMIKEERAVLVHSNSQKAHFIAALATWWAGTAFVWHARDILVRKELETISDLTAAGFADAVIAISKAVAGRFRVAAPRVKVIYNGIDVGGLAARVRATDREAARKRLGVPPGVPLVVNVGQLSRWKGQDVFLRAAALTLTEFPEAYFAVVGGPIFGEREYESFLCKLAGDLGLGSRAVFTGQLEDVSAVYAAADVLVHTPVEPEPFGRVVVEAMAAGVPVVASRSGGIPEVVTDGTDGLLFEPRDARAAAQRVREVLGDRRKGRALVSAALRRAADFEIARSVGYVEGLYEELLSVEKQEFGRARVPDYPLAVYGTGTDADA